MLDFVSKKLIRLIVAKGVLKTRLQWIISSCPQANPSRTTLKRVNDFLLSRPPTLCIPGCSDRTSGHIAWPSEYIADDT